MSRLSRTLSTDILEAFELAGRPRVLTGGTRPVYQVGNVVLKQLHQTSLENSSSLELFVWLAPRLHDVTERGFRLSKPIATKRGNWLAGDGWTAWTYVD